MVKNYNPQVSTQFIHGCSCAYFFNFHFLVFELTFFQFSDSSRTRSNSRFLFFSNKNSYKNALDQCINVYFKSYQKRSEFWKKKNDAICRKTFLSVRILLFIFSCFYDRNFCIRKSKKNCTDWCFEYISKKKEESNKRCKIIELYLHKYTHQMRETITFKSQQLTV